MLGTQKRTLVDDNVEDSVISDFNIKGTPVLFHKSFMKEQYFLLELPSDIEDLNDLSIRGLEKDDAVLCSKDKSYSLRCVCTSNQTLLCNEKKENFVIMGSTTNLLEISGNSTSGINRLKDITQKQCLIGKEYPKLPLGISLKEVKSIIQLSDLESFKILEELGFLVYNPIQKQWYDLSKIKNKSNDSDELVLYTLDNDYLESSLKLFIFSVVGEGFNLNELDEDKCIRLLENEYSDFIIMNILSRFGNQSLINEDLKISLNIPLICTFLGERVLSRMSSTYGNSPISLDLFLEEWMNSVPDAIFGFDINCKLLKGICILDEPQNKIQYFPRHKLALDPKKRFEQLYTIRHKWIYSDICEFLSDIVPDSKKRDALILKYSRLSTLDNIKYVTSRFTFFSK